MSLYVTLEEVKNGSRDVLLESTVTQDMLDEAEQYFESYYKDLALTVDDVETPVAWEVKKYIIATTFFLAAMNGKNNNLATVALQGETVDPYKDDIKIYQKQMDYFEDKLSRDVICKTDSSSRSRVPKDNRIGRA